MGAKTVNSVLQRFHPAVAGWFAGRFERPSAIQRAGWKAIAASHGRKDVLLCAPTGSGKTLAAFLWALNNLVEDRLAGRLGEQVSVVYVSPLKALANDIRVNLAEPLEGIAAAGAAGGLELCPIRAGLRTGDTPASEREAMARRPPHILVTTPESLFLLLLSERFRGYLQAVRWVIVDELHAVAANKRGAHLAVTLERLERLVRQAGEPRPARIGLSATLRPVATLARFLSGAEVDSAGRRRFRPVDFVRVDSGPRRLDLKVIAPGPPLGPLATHAHWEALYDALAALVRGHRTTLIFTLSRRQAERVALNLQRRLGDAAVVAHHGSLARAARIEAEQRLKRGELKAIVATASLELGIDIGAVDLVCQIDSARSLTAALQRLGRSSHWLGGVPKGRFFALSLDELAALAATVRALGAGLIDEVEMPRGCRDVAAQQIIAVAAQQEEIGVAELSRLLRGAWHFADLTAPSLERLLSEMAAEPPCHAPGGQAKIIYDRQSGRVRARRAARIAALEGAGTIPENGNCDVVVASDGRKIGDVEEDFAQEVSRGDVFALGSAPWRALGLSRGRLLVEPAPASTPTAPFWEAEAPGRSPALSQALSELRIRLEHLARQGKRAAALKWLERECALEPAAAAQLFDYVARGLAALGAVPSRRTVVVERFFDGLGGTQVVIHAPFGMRLNRALGLALRKRLCQNFDFEIQASATDDAVLLALTGRHSFALETLLGLLAPGAARPVLEQAVLGAPMFELRFRHVATRALTVARAMRGNKVPPYLQRLRAQDLLAGLFPGQQACFENRPPVIPIPEHHLVAEAMRECLEEATDLPGLIALLGACRRGTVKVAAVESVAPSVFAHQILLAWDYSFIDGGERANRRSRTVRTGSARGAEPAALERLALAPPPVEAVRQAQAEASFTAPARRAQNRDELCEIVRAYGLFPWEKIADCTSGDGAAMVAELAAEGRIACVQLDEGGPRRLVSAEDLAGVQAVYSACRLLAPPLAAGGDTHAASRPPASYAPGARHAGRSSTPDPAAGALPVEPAAARQELVLRALRTGAAASAAALASTLALPAAQVEGALAALEAGGAIFRAARAPAQANGGNDAEQWWERYHLERVRRLTLKQLRPQFEPCDNAAFAALRLEWLGVAPRPGAVWLAGVLDRMTGLRFGPKTWESAILPARLPGFRPKELDELCLRGEFQWIAADTSQGALLPARITFVRRGSPLLGLLADDVPNEHALAQEQELLLEALKRGGAQYLDELCRATGLGEDAALGALWTLAAKGLASNDGYAPLSLLCGLAAARRALSRPAEQSPCEHRASRNRIGLRPRALSRLRARLKASGLGRWSRLARDHDAHPGGPSFEELRQAAQILLDRNGVLSREVLAWEGWPAAAWSRLAPVLRRMEYAGLWRRGLFVSGLSPEQYATGQALEALKDPARRRPPARQYVALCAADPANPFGTLLPGCGIARSEAAVVVLSGGAEFILGIEHGNLLLGDTADRETVEQGLQALIGFAGKLSLETIDGVPALQARQVPLLAKIGFHSNGRALVWDGLSGPVPAAALVPTRGFEAAR